MEGVGKAHSNTGGSSQFRQERESVVMFLLLDTSVVLQGLRQTNCS